MNSCWHLKKQNFNTQIDIIFISNNTINIKAGPYESIYQDHKPILIGIRISNEEMVKVFHNFKNSLVSEKFKKSDMNDDCLKKNTQIVNNNCTIIWGRSFNKINNNNNKSEQVLINIIELNVLPTNSLLEDFSFDNFFKYSKK